MQYHPYRKLKPLVIVSFPLLVCTLIFWILTYLQVGPRSLNQLGTVLFLTALIFLLVRYALTDFIYQLPEEENRLTIKTVRGRLPRTAAEIKLCKRDRILPWEKGLAKKEGIQQMENFCVSLFPEESYLYLTVLGGKKTALRLECSKDVADLIRARIDALPDEEEEEE
ncbi:MAG: hypothetical protein J6R82_06810 [Clostridia bacterium]|nr:hypothetical protein [Clostridia bacterium]